MHQESQHCGNLKVTLKLSVDRVNEGKISESSIFALFVSEHLYVYLNMPR